MFYVYALSLHYICCIVAVHSEHPHVRSCVNIRTWMKNRGCLAVVILLKYFCTPLSWLQIESDADSSSSTVAIEHQQTGLVSLRIKVEGIPEQEPGQSAPMLAGNRKALGAWNMDKAMKMTDNGSGAWETDILVPPGPLEFKVRIHHPGLECR